jgi:hypothetical protein
VTLERAEMALRAHRRLARIYRHIERAPEWAEVMADLQDAKQFYEASDCRTTDETILYYRICAALGK